MSFTTSDLTNVVDFTEYGLKAITQGIFYLADLVLLTFCGNTER